MDGSRLSTFKAYYEVKGSIKRCHPTVSRLPTRSNDWNHLIGFHPTYCIWVVLYNLTPCKSNKCLSSSDKLSYNISNVTEAVSQLSIRIGRQITQEITWINKWAGNLWEVNASFQDTDWVEPNESKASGMKEMKMRTSKAIAFQLTLCGLS